MAEAESKHPDYHPSYILTTNFYRKVRILKTQLGLQPNQQDREFCDEVLNQFKSFMARYLPDANLSIVNMDALGDAIFSSAVKQHPILRNAVLISTCSEFTSLHRGLSLEINRIFDAEGVQIGIGPRPGHPILAEQIKQIRLAYHGESIVIVEDGTFTGSTLIHILKKFEKSGVKISAIVIGFAFPEALEKLRSVYDGDIIQMTVIKDFVDWMPDHDFFPFFPNCGRVLGHKWSDHFIPLYTHDNATYSVPYIMPFIGRKTMNEWTGIPQKYCLELSKYCSIKAFQFFERVQQELNETITVNHLLQTKPRVNVPINLSSNTFPNVNASVVEFLSDICHELA